MAASAKPGLRVRKLADRSEGERIERFDPVTGAKKLVNPATPGDDHEPWPLLGLAIEGEPPAECRVPTSFVGAGMEEGWLTAINPRPAHRPGGPPTNPWKVTHTFLHADALVLHTVDGDVRYRVTRQPDKYAVVDYMTGPYGGRIAITDDEAPVTDEAYAAGDTDVSWFYDLQREED